MPKLILSEINAAAVSLVEVGLVDDYNAATLQRGVDHLTVGTPVPVDSSVVKNIAYADLYNQQVEKGAYNLRFLDGAIVQLSYRFVLGALERHRLAYLPSPDLEPFQSDPDLYIADVPYLDAVGFQVMAVPVRFDFDCRPDVSSEGHPVSHLTLGQYRDCRIPLSGPAAPRDFLHFLLKSFYSGSSLVALDLEPTSVTGFDATISDNQRLSTHVVVPGYP